MELGGNVIGSIAGSLHLEGEGDTIEVNPILTSGTKIATITVNEGKPDEESYDLYAPEYTPFSGVYNDLTGKPYLNGDMISGNMYTNNFSTVETAIGSWIDGSVIYQRTFILPNEIVINNFDWTSIGIGAGSIRFYINCDAQNTSGTKWAVNAATINNNICLLTNRNGDTIGVKYVTIQYLKN